MVPRTINASDSRLRLIIPGAGHFSIIHDTVARATIVEWLEAVLTMEARRPPIHPTRGTILGMAVFALGAGTLALLGALVGLAFREAEGMGASEASGSLALAVPLAVGIAIGGTLYGVVSPAFDQMNVSGAPRVLSALWAIAIPLAVLDICARTIFRSLRSIPMGLDIRPRAVAMSLLVAAVCALYLLGGLAVVTTGFVDLPITGSRIRLSLTLICLSILPIAVLEAWTIRVSGYRSGGRIAAVIASVVGVGAFAWKVRLHFQGAHMLFLLVTILFVATSPIVSWPAGRLSGSMTAVLLKAIALGALLAAVCPFYA